MTDFGEGEDAGERDVEIGQDADRRALDDVGAEAMEVAGSGAAGIDQGSGARAPGHRLRLHAEAGAAPVNMGVQVDQTGHHELARGRDDLARRGSIDLGLDGRDPAILERDVGAPIPSLRGIDHPPAPDYEVVHAVLLPDQLDMLDELLSQHAYD